MQSSSCIEDENDSENLAISFYKTKQQQNEKNKNNNNKFENNKCK